MSDNLFDSLMALEDSFYALGGCSVHKSDLEKVNQSVDIFDSDSDATVFSEGKSLQRINNE